MNTLSNEHKEAIHKVALARGALLDAERELRMFTDPRACQHAKWELHATADGIECCECGVYCTGEALAALGFRYGPSKAESHGAELRKPVAR